MIYFKIFDNLKFWKNKNKFLDKLTEAISDIDIAKPVIGGSLGIALIIGFVYMLFIYLFAGIIVWIIMIIYCILLFILGLLAYNKYLEIDT